MRAGTAEVIQHIGVVAARFFERIRENGQAVESTLFVDARRERDSGFGPPRRSERDRPKWIAEDAADKGGLNRLFGSKTSFEYWTAGIVVGWHLTTFSDRPR